MIIQCIGSFDRIQEYCNYASGSELAGEGLETAVGHFGSDISLRSPAKGGEKKAAQNPSRSIDGQSFSWSKTGPPVLRDLRTSIPPGTITAIVGPVGSGKSAFLNSLLGEMISMPRGSGNWTERSSSIGPAAYCSQQPWLQNATIRQNIMGTTSFDREWYQSVKHACGLDTDMRQLAKGDCTRVGSKGLNLSGGQKQRIVSR